MSSFQAALASVVYLVATGPVFSSTLIPLSGHHFEHTYDSARHRLYIPTENGTVERYDLISEQLLEPFVVGNDLRGSDTSPDSQYLYVADRQRVGNQRLIHKIDLDSGTAISIASDALSRSDRGTSDIAITSNGRAHVTTTSGISGRTAMMAIDIHTDSWTALDGDGSYFHIPVNSQLTRSADRSLTLGVSGGTFGYAAPRYDATSDALTHLPQISGWTRTGALAVNRDGSLLAIEEMIYQPDATLVQELPFSPYFVGGLAFDPLQDVLYMAERGSDSVIVYDTDSWAELGRIPVGENLGVSYIPESNYMSTSADARLLFVTTASGVRVLENRFAVPEPATSIPALTMMLALIVTVRQRLPRCSQLTLT